MKSKSLRLHAVLIGLAMMGMAAPWVAAADRTWDGNGGSPPTGLFGSAGNWNPNAVPLAGDNAIFNIADAYAVFFSNSPTNTDLLFDDGTVSFTSSGGGRTYTLADDALLTGGGAEADQPEAGCHR